MKVDEFWLTASNGDDSCCWEWQGCRISYGYGRVRYDGKTRFAHRVAWELTHGQIPDGLCVLHICDNPPCCNPAHLFLGTKADNNADKVSKNRQARGDTHGSRTHPERLACGDANGSRLHPESRQRGDAHYSRLHPERLARGEGHGKAKLTEEQVQAILWRDLYGQSRKDIAADFGISPEQVGNIVRGKHWGHLEGRLSDG